LNRFKPHYEWQPEWTNEQVMWLTDFLINKISVPIYCLEKLSKCNGVNKELLESCVKNLRDIEDFVRRIEQKYGY
jgi:hypothetical protein